jgi:hypothetical protein
VSLRQSKLAQKERYLKMALNIFIEGLGSNPGVIVNGYSPDYGRHLEDYSLVEPSDILGNHQLHRLVGQA